MVGIPGRKVATIGGKDIIIAPETPKEVCEKMRGKYVEFEVDGKKVSLCAFQAENNGDSIKYEPLEFNLDDTFLRSKILKALNGNSD